LNQGVLSTMDLHIQNKYFLVTGASSGFGRAVAERLLTEGAQVIAVARRIEKLEELKQIGGDHVSLIQGDLTKESVLREIVEEISALDAIAGAVLNAGGPPPGPALETDIEQWDEAYQLVMRWKIILTQRLVAIMKQQNYGRLVFIESGSIKQPVPDLVLSNAFRAGIAGFAKTLSQEVADMGITVNLLAPGAHNAPAIERVIQTKADKEQISFAEAQQQLEQSIPVKRLGDPAEMASLAAWLLSKHAGFVTGQTISHDGGKNVSLFG